MTMYRRVRRIPTPLIVGLALLLALVLAVVFGTPRVIKFSPPAGNRQVPSTAPIVIEFSREMDAASVESRLTIDPLPAGRFVWQGKALVFEPDAPWPEAAEITVRLSAGSRTRRFIPMLRGASWSFTIGAPRVLYLWPSNAPADLFARTEQGGEAERLTEAPLGVHDFSLSYDGTAVVYVIERADGGTDLRLLDLAAGDDRLLYACPTGSRCHSPCLSPDEDMVAFELFEMQAGVAGKEVPGPGRIWMIKLEGDEEARLISPQDRVTSSPRWSPNGKLTYYDNTIKAIVLADVEGEGGASSMIYIPTSLGNMSTWSPDGDSMVFTEIVFPEEAVSSEESPAEIPGGHEGHTTQFYSHLFRFEVATSQITDLSYAALDLVEDASPAYSPDGRWIAFARKYLGPEDWTPGRQLWLMRADGSLLTQLTDDPDYNHSSLAWSPDSRALAFMRFSQTDFSELPTIWLVEIDSLQTSLLVGGGYMPQWVP
jgi:Tol biopolymer transport system component